MFFSLSKIVWFFANPGNILLIGLCAGALGGILPYKRAQRLGRALMACTVALAVCGAILPWSTWLGLPLEERFPTVHTLPEHVDGIVVAGGVVNAYMSNARGQIAIGGGAERVFELGRLANRYPDAKLVYSAGSGSLFRQELKEADYVQPLLDAMGVAPSRLIIENQSRNTHENAVFTRDLVKPGPDERWLLVTSAFHMPRTMGTFAQAGWRNLTAYPVDYHVDPTAGGLRFDLIGGMKALNLYTHEWLGLLAYWLTGRTNALFPAPAQPGNAD